MRQPSRIGGPRPGIKGSRKTREAAALRKSPLAVAVGGALGKVRHDKDEGKVESPLSVLSVKPKSQNTCRKFWIVVLSVMCSPPTVALLCLFFFCVRGDGLVLPCSVDDCRGRMVELADGFSCVSMDECDALLKAALDGVVPSDHEQVVEAKWRSLQGLGCAVFDAHRSSTSVALA